MKKCPRCNKIQKPEQFYTRKRGGLSGHCRSCAKEKWKEYHTRHDRRKKDAEYYQKNKSQRIQKQATYQKKRRAEQIEVRILDNLRTRLSKALIKKSNSSIKLLGCNPKKLKEHLESKFQKGMSWENYGLHGWHIDHIIPCKHFDLTKPEQQKQCFHFSNLQPLWAKDNLKKSCSVPKQYGDT